MRAELQEIVDEFAEAPKDFRLTILLDFANNLPPVPDHIDREVLEQVHECQTPFFVAAEVGDDPDRFAFGRTAEVIDGSGETFTWTLVGPTEADLSAGRLSPAVFVMDSSQHAWLFPRMTAVVHQYGAGTTT